MTLCQNLNSFWKTVLLNNPAFHMLNAISKQLTNHNHQIIGFTWTDIKP
jgi:hypothetical protein